MRASLFTGVLVTGYGNDAVVVSFWSRRLLRSAMEYDGLWIGILDR